MTIFVWEHFEYLKATLRLLKTNPFSVPGQNRCEECISVKGDPEDPRVGSYRCQLENELVI